MSFHCNNYDNLLCSFSNNFYSLISSLILQLFSYFFKYFICGFCIALGSTAFVVSADSYSWCTNLRFELHCELILRAYIGGTLSSERFCDVLLGSRNVISLAPHKFPFEISVQPKSLCLISPTLLLVQSSSPAVPMWAFAFRKSYLSFLYLGLTSLILAYGLFLLLTAYKPSKVYFSCGI